MANRRNAPDSSVFREVPAGSEPATPGPGAASRGHAYEAAVQFLISRGEQRSGQDYLEALVRFLGETLGVANVVCGRVADGEPPVIETLARYADGEIAPNIQYPLAGTPCAEVVGKGFCFFGDAVRDRFPDGGVLGELGAESYAAIPLFGAAHDPLGILAVIDTGPLDNPGLVEDLLTLLGISAASEMERDLYEVRLQISETRFRDFAEIASDWLWETDEHLRFSYFSERTEELGGFDPSKYLGKTRQDLAVGDMDTPAWRAHFQEIEKRRPFRNFEYAFLTSNGEVFSASISGRPVHDDDGKFMGYRGVGANITARKRTEEALRESEHRFQDFAEVSSDWFWETDRDNRFTYFSPRNREITGFDPSYYLGKTRYDILPPDISSEAWQAHLEDLTHHRPFRDFRYRLDREGMAPLYLSISGAPVFDRDGAFAGYRGTGTDVTREVLMERERDDERQLLRTVLDNLPFPVSLNDAAGRYLFANLAFEEWYGVQPDTLVGRTADEVFDLSQEELDRRARMERAVLEAGEVQSAETTKRLAGGSVNHVVVTKFPVRDRNGNVSGFASLSTDITKRKNSEIALQHMNERLVAASRAKSEFLAHMSHELRTPLNSILGFSQIIREAAFGEDQIGRYREYAGDIHVSASHLLELINDILDIAKIEAGEITVEAQDVDLSDVIESSLRLVAQQFQSKTHVPAISYPKTPPRLHADPRLLRQVLVNILSNASKFTPRNGSIEIAVSYTDTGALELVVKDSGIGMSDADLLRALEPFGQVRHSPDVAHGGTGLGLPLSKNLVELHGGELTVESAPGVGTEVRILFPPERSLHVD